MKGQRHHKDNDQRPNEDQGKEETLIAQPLSKSSTVRVQYGALPYRFNKAGEVEVLLITSRSRRRWIIPKGWSIKGLKPAQSAAHEAFEDAGVRGTVSNKPIGHFIYDKQLDEDGRCATCEVTVFPLAVKRQLKTWPEIEQREIRWVLAHQVVELTGDDHLRPLLDADSDDPGRLFRSDPGHHSDLMPVGQKPDRFA